MKKSKEFDHVHFDDQAIGQYKTPFWVEVDEKERQTLSKILSAGVGEERWVTSATI